MSPDPPPTLDGATALVTDASGGIGTALVTELMRRGTRVAAAGRDSDRLEALEPAAIWSGDLREPGAAEKAVDFAHTTLGALQIAINAAGVVAFGPVAELVPVTAREGRRAGIRVLDARPGHTETGLVARPLAGTAPNLPAGLTPEHAAVVICDVIARGERDLPPAAFESPADA